MTTLLFDIGANVGAWALANYNPNTRIVSVEASPTTYTTLIQNTAGKNIHCINRAVTSQPVPDVTFYEAHGTTISSLNKDWIMDSRSRFGGVIGIRTETVVPTTTIDSMVATFGVPDIIKVDVEGAEHIVLPSLTQKVKTVCFEWAAEWDVELLMCIDHMSKIGYTRFHIQMEDSYTFRPLNYEMDANQLKDKIATMNKKVDWGMIWCN
jgi:FkbM family methyltransferase